MRESVGVAGATRWEAGNTAAESLSVRLLATLATLRPGGCSDLVFPLREEAPGTVAPSSGPFVPGTPDTPLAAAPANCLFLCQLSRQLLSPHNGVRTRPQGFGSGELNLFPRLG